MDELPAACHQHYTAFRSLGKYQGFESYVWPGTIWCEL